MVFPRKHPPNEIRLMVPNQSESAITIKIWFKLTRINRKRFQLGLSYPDPENNNNNNNKEKQQRSDAQLSERLVSL